MADLAESLVSSGEFDVVVACPDGGYLPDRLSGAGIRVAPWRASREPGPATSREVVTLRRLVAQIEPDIVHLHSSKAGLAGRLAIRGGRPTVFTPHAWSFLHLHGAMRSAAVSWERFAARWTDLLLCISAGEAQAGKDAGIDGAYAVIPNSVVMEDPGLTRTQARARLGLPTDGALAVCVGRFTEQKGQDVLLRAWPDVRRALPGARLAIAGHGDASGLRSLASDDVIFREISERSDVALWITASDVMVFPSRWEGLSLTVLEALQLGRAVVVSDCDGMREALEGGAGTMVAVEDAEGLATALHPYLGDLSHAQAMGEQAAQRYMQVHAPRLIADRARYRALLHGLLSTT